MTKLLIATLTVLMVSACGKDSNSVPYIASQKITKTPDPVEKQVGDMLSQLGKMELSDSMVNNLSSRAVRNEIIGLNINFNKVDKDTFNIQISSSYKDGAVGQCSRIDYSVQNAKLTTLKTNGVQVDNLGTLRCINNCNYLVLIIKKSPSAVASSDGNVIEAAVPVILENKTKGGDLLNAQFLPTNSDDDAFLKFYNDETNYCVKPIHHIKQEDVAIPINPNDGDDQPNYDYFDFGSPSFF